MNFEPLNGFVDMRKIALKVVMIDQNDIIIIKRIKIGFRVSIPKY